MFENLVSDSIFEDERIESRNNDKLSGSKSVPITLGSSNLNAGDDSDQEFCGCATNHKILDETNSRIVGGKEVMPNSLPWQAFVRIKKVG